MLNVPFLFNPFFNGMEPTQHLLPNHGDVIANEYRVDALIGQGTFASVYSATSIQHSKRVGVKILVNDKSCFDAGLNEVHIHSLVQQNDPDGHYHILRMVDYFYTREHLFIVTELLNNSVFDHYMHLETLGRRADFYNAETLGALSAQMLDAFRFLHGIEITHCDVKSTNICILNWAARQFKLIDLGSATLTYDAHSSYVQSRWYRAPEIILGCEYGPKIDLWSLGCVLAELIFGCCVFQFPTSVLVLAAQRAACGPFPLWMTASPLADLFFTTSGIIYEVDPPNMTAGIYLLRDSPNSSLSSMIDARVDPTVFGEVLSFKSFLQSLLTIDPNNRLTASDAIEHVWLAQYRLLPQPPAA